LHNAPLIEISFSNAAGNIDNAIFKPLGIINDRGLAIAVHREMIHPGPDRPHLNAILVANFKKPVPHLTIF